MADALAMLKKNSDSNSNTNNSDRILERKQWYVACIVRAIKACAMLTSWPEREMDALVNVLLRVRVSQIRRKESRRQRRKR